MEKRNSEYFALRQAQGDRVTSDGSGDSALRQAQGDRVTSDGSGDSALRQAQGKRGDSDDGEGLRLLKRFDKQRDNRAVATELVTRLRLQMLVQLRRHWRSKTYAWDDLESAALIRLVEWRQAGKLRKWEGSIALLAYRLLEVEIEKERVHRSLEKDLREVIDADPELVFSPTLDPERTAMARELFRKTLELIAKLPEQYAVVFQALIDEEQDGPRMEAALGITRDAAEKRLKRARVALLNLAVDEGFAGELKGFLESEG